MSTIIGLVSTFRLPLHFCSFWTSSCPPPPQSTIRRYFSLHHAKKGGLLCNPPFLRGGARKSGRLDVEAEGRHAEVQNASRCTRAEDQT